MGRVQAVRMKMIQSLVEALWGVSVPVEHLAALASYGAQSCIACLGRGRR